MNGVYISDFLTPHKATDFVYPASMQEEIQRVAGGYEFDVTFRAEDRERIGAQLTQMTRKHFAVARHLWAKEEWDFFAIHEIGPDRLHHTFWKYFDTHHPRYEENPKFRAIVEGYYAMLDDEIGSLLSGVPDDVRVLLLSDHGSQAMAGGFCINEWLIRQGHLTLKGPRPPPGTPLEKTTIDWSKTRAWGAGGYYARIFYNVKGREPEGILPPKEVPRFEAQLGSELRALRRPDGASLDADVRSPRGSVPRGPRGRSGPHGLFWECRVALRRHGRLRFSVPGRERYGPGRLGPLLRRHLFHLTARRRRGNARAHREAH